MNEKATLIIFYIIFSLSILCMIRVGIIHTGSSNLCEYYYGENYIYNVDREFGQYCIELNYKTLAKENPKPYNWTNAEKSKICQIPGFFELNKWKGENC